jgi:putative serine protease PepD
MIDDAGGRVDGPADGQAPDSGRPAASSPATRRPRQLPTRALLAVGVAIALVSGLLGGLIARWAARGAPATSCPAAAVADSVLPSVVTLTVSGGGASGTGSGEVIRDSGHILTNDHVIAPAASSGTIDVLFSSGQTARATVVGRAIEVDLAVIKVTPPDGLPMIAIGQSAPLRVGQPVVALGSPLGLTGTVTSGIISALGRDVPVPADGGGTAVLPGAIQTDAAINPGNSGGALVDCAGKLVGVNTAIATVPNPAGQAGGGNVGIGFAIPVDVAVLVANQLIDRGRFTPPYLGVAVTPIPPQVARRFQVPSGLFLQAVTPNSPAQQAGLRPGDVITSVDRRTTRGPDDLFLATLTKNVGDQVTIDYTRAGRADQTLVTLGDPP